MHPKVLSAVMDVSDRTAAAVRQSSNAQFGSAARYPINTDLGMPDGKIFVTSSKLGLNSSEGVQIEAKTNVYEMQPLTCSSPKTAKTVQFIREQESGQVTCYLKLRLKWQSGIPGGEGDSYLPPERLASIPLVVLTFCYGAEYLAADSLIFVTDRDAPGVYVLLASLAMYHLLLKHNKTTATWALCALLTMIFLIATADFCLFVAVGFKLMIGALIKNTELELLERLEIANASVIQIDLAELWLNGNSSSLLFIFGDGIVVWRAWAIWHDQRSVIILPGLTLLATFGATMSIVTNLMATILIGLKTYQHWRFMKDTIGSGHSAAGKVLMFLTESGIVYIGFQIINVCLSLLDTTAGTALDIATEIWASIMCIVSAIYPSLVILIVTNQHSISHITYGSTGIAGGDRNPGTHISFAHSALQETTDPTEDHTEAAVQSLIERHHDIEKVSEAQEMKDLV
ncbi:hypothetical protein C8J56DRAFT_1119678 [Mycena floridula]|nr:hypothetical protein C8J56DRAFT_1119678 [Mycena floridula]